MGLKIHFLKVKVHLGRKENDRIKLSKRKRGWWKMKEIKKLVALILIVSPIFSTVSVSAIPKMTSESRQLENKSFDSSKIGSPIENTLSSSEKNESSGNIGSSSTGTTQTEESTIESTAPSKTTMSTSDSASTQSEKQTIQKRAVSADGYTEATTTAELATLLADETVSKIRLTGPLTFDREFEIKRDIVVDFGGFSHDFGTHHIYINEQPHTIEFQNFKGTAAHPGGITPNIDGNAMIIAYMTDFWGSRYHFTGELRFTGTLDLYNGSKIGLVYAPRATVTLDSVSGILDIQPVKEGLNAAPGKAYFCRSYQLNVINGSNLYGPYLGKFYGFLDSGDETGSGKSSPGVHILDGSKVVLDYDRADAVSDEGEAIDTLPSDVTFEVKGSGSTFSVHTKINITNDNNRGIIQMRGSGSKVLVSEGGQLIIDTATTGGFRLQGDSSQINVSSGGKIQVQMASDGDQPGNNGMRFVGKGLSLTVDGQGSAIDIKKQAGRSSAIRFENGTQKLTVTNGGALKVTNKGDGKSYVNRLNQGNQAIQFYDSSGFLESPGSADFTVTGERSSIDIRVDSGPTVDTTGDIDLNFTAGEKTYLVMIGKTGEDKTGIISGDALKVDIQSPTYFDFQNKRVGDTSTGVGGWVFQGNGESSLAITHSEIALWRKEGATFDNIEKDPDYFSDLTDLTIDGTDLGNFVSSQNAGLADEFAQTGAGMQKYNRISANNQIPVIENLRVPTNADKKIYGHVVVPEGIEATPRDAWTDEVEVTVRISYADKSKAPVELTAKTRGQVDQQGGEGYDPWGEGEQGGLFEIQVPKNERLAAGDEIQVIAAKKVKGNHAVIELNTAKTAVDIIPPEPAKLSTQIVNAASSTISGTGEPGALAILKKGQEELAQATVNDEGNFTLAIPPNQLTVGDTLEVILNDCTGEASAKGVINKPTTNDELGNRNPSEDAVTYHDAPAFQPAPKLVVEGGLSLTVPSAIQFGEVKANGLTQEAYGKIDAGQLLVYDQREVKNPWLLTVKLSKPLTAQDQSAVVLRDALYFKSGSDYQLMSEQELPVVTGQNTDNHAADYSEYLNNGAAFKAVLIKENQVAGSYSAEMTWTLTDAPTE